MATQETLTAEVLSNHINEKYLEIDSELEHEKLVNSLPKSLLDESFSSDDIQITVLPGGLAGPGPACGLLVEGLLSRMECKNIIDYTEKVGYGYIGKSKAGKAYRGNTRVMCKDEALDFTSALWERIKPLVPSTIKYEDCGTPQVWQASKLNPHYRFAKYKKGQGFAKHVDKQTLMAQTYQTMFTVNIYLNDISTENKGRTRFYGKRGGLGKPIAASGGVAGSVAIFPQTYNEEISPWHDGQMLSGGLKYLMRTDVIYDVFEGTDGGETVQS